MTDSNFDFYEILGLTKDATEDQIKKSYRKLAILYHPDKQIGKSDEEVKKAEEMFKKISEAYQILSDSQQRKYYDRFGRYGPNGLNGSMKHENQFSSKEAFNIFNQFFDKSNGFNVFGTGFFGPNCQSTDFEDMSSFTAKPTNFANINRYRKREGDTCTLKHSVKLADFYNGKTKKIRVDFSIGSERVSDIIDIEIEKGWRPGVRLTFHGKSSCKEDEVPGNLIIELVEERTNNHNNNFIRRIDVSPHLYANSSQPDNERYADLVYVLPITQKEVRLGCQKIIKHMDDRKISIQVPVIDQSTKEIKIKNEGMPIRKNGTIIGNGDLYIRFDIAFETI